MTALDPLPSLGVVVAFGRLIKPPVLAAVPMVNIHFSLLPRWRGVAPVERAILAGDSETGVCLMDVEEGLDTGAVYRRLELAIGPDETADQLGAAWWTPRCRCSWRRCGRGWAHRRGRWGSPPTRTRSLRRSC